MEKREDWKRLAVRESDCPTEALRDFLSEARVSRRESIDDDGVSPRIFLILAALLEIQNWCCFW